MSRNFASRETTSRRLTQSEKRADTRRRLLEAAERVFAMRGYETASVDEVAEAAGLSKGALYYNFASKEELFLAVVDHRAKESFRMLEEILDRQETVSEKLGALARVMGAHRASPDALALQIEGWLQAVREPKLRRRLTHGLAQVRSAVADLIESQLSGEALPLPASELAAGVLALGTGLALLHVLEPTSTRPGLFAALVALFVGRDVPPALRGRKTSNV